METTAGAESHSILPAAETEPAYSAPCFDYADAELEREEEYALDVQYMLYHDLEMCDRNHPAGTVERVTTFKLLGIHLDDTLT